MAAACADLEPYPSGPMPDGGCSACLAEGSTWVHLRFCVECETTLCCDNSPRQHASRHAATSGHPVIRSKEPDEEWAYCYTHFAFAEPS